MAAVMSPRPMAFETAIDTPTRRISVMDVDEIVALYTQTVKVLKKLEEREVVILAEHGIDRPRKRAYTLRDTDSGYGTRVRGTPRSRRSVESFRDDSAVPSSIITRRTSPRESRPATPIDELSTSRKVHIVPDPDEREDSSSDSEDGIAALKAMLRRTLDIDDRLIRDHASRLRQEEADVDRSETGQWPLRTVSIHSAHHDEEDSGVRLASPIQRRSRSLGHFSTAEGERRLATPGILPLPTPGAHRPDRNSFDEPDPNTEAEIQPAVVWQSATIEPDAPAEPSSGHSEKLSVWERTRATFKATYLPAKHDAPLILPSGPTDEEKLGYLHTNRVVLYCAGVFSFLSLATGMWLFVASSYYFAWFAIFCIAMQLYMGVGYVVGLVGKDFDYENHKRVLRDHPIDPDTCPTVDIYLPVCKEPIEILNNTWKYVNKLKYPRHKLNVYILDDGAQDAVRDLAARFKFEYIVRGDRPRLKKAGNLRWAFQRTTGDFFNIYDADFCPREDFLLELVPMMLEDPKTAIVQSPQFFRTKSEQTWVEQGAGAVQELFYRVVQVNTPGRQPELARVHHCQHNVHTVERPESQRPDDLLVAGAGHRGSSVHRCRLFTAAALPVADQPAAE